MANDQKLWGLCTYIVLGERHLGDSCGLGWAHEKIRLQKCSENLFGNIYSEEGKKDVKAV